MRQVAQLSQRDRATAAWVSFGQKWKTIFSRQYRFIFNHYESASKAIELGEITQNKGYYAVQGNSRSPMSVPIESPYAD